MPNRDAMNANNSPSTISNDVDISPMGTEKKPKKIKTIPEMEKIRDNIVCTFIKMSNFIFLSLHIFSQKRQLYPYLLGRFAQRSFIISSTPPLFFLFFFLTIKDLSLIS